MRSTSLPAIALLACTLCGCSAFLPRDSACLEFTTTLPADTGAWLCSAAGRSVLPQADPVPWHRGLPVGIDGRGYSIRLQQRVDGRWACRADGRLFAADDGAGLPALQFAVEPMPGFASPLASGIELVVTPLPSGSRITLRQGGGVPPALVIEVQELLDLATAVQDGERRLLGGDAAACAHASQQAAERHAAGEDPVRAQLTARLWLQVALACQRLGDTAAELQALRRASLADQGRPGRAGWLGELEGRCGRADAAARQLRQSAATATDPLLRLAAAIDARTAAAQPTVSGAMERLRARHDEQLRLGDRHGAAATALLLREREPSTGNELQLAMDLRALGHGSMADRALARARSPALALRQFSVTALTLSLLGGATPELPAQPPR